jgi:hypothetical protein
MVNRMDWGELVERQIQDAMARGEFRNLPGEGRPLDLTQNPLLDPSMEAAYKILQDNGFAPEWIEAGKEVRARIEKWRGRVESAWEAYRREMDSATVGASRWAESRRLEAEGRWQREWERMCGEAVALNKEIATLNLKIPMAGLHVPLLRPERILQELRAASGRESGTGEKGRG